MCCKAVLSLTQRLCGSNLSSLADTSGSVSEPKGVVCMLFASWLLLENFAHVDTVYYTVTNKHTQKPTVSFNSALWEHTHTEDTGESVGKGSTIK